jgi:hypothetical protein
MITEAEVIEALRRALDVKGFNIESSVENTEEWDSLGSLTIFTTLSRLTNGYSDEIGGIASMTTAKEIITALKENEIIK